MHTCNFSPMKTDFKNKDPKKTGRLPASHQASSSLSACHWPRRPPSRAAPHQPGAVETVPGGDQDGHQQDGKGEVYLGQLSTHIC